MTRSDPPALSYLGVDPDTERHLYLVQLEDPAHLPEDPGIEGDHFVTLVTLGSTPFPDASIMRLARQLIDRGAVYFCVWGPGCERVHDLIDSEWLADGFEPDSEFTLLTTWHTDEPLEDVIWFAVHAAEPCQPFVDACRSVVAICLDAPDAALEIEAAFSG